MTPIHNQALSGQTGFEQRNKSLPSLSRLGHGDLQAKRMQISMAIKTLVHPCTEKAHYKFLMLLDRFMTICSDETASILCIKAAQQALPGESHGQPLLYPCVYTCAGTEPTFTMLACPFMPTASCLGLTLEVLSMVPEVRGVKVTGMHYSMTPVFQAARDHLQETYGRSWT